MTALDPKSNCKFVKTLDYLTITAPDTITSEDDGDVIDTKGWDYCTIILLFGAITAGSVVTAKVQEGSTASSFADITGASWTVADDDDGQLFVGQIRCYEHLRYLNVSVGAATQDAIVGAIAILSNAKDTTAYATLGTGEYGFSFDV